MGSCIKIKQGPQVPKSPALQSIKHSGNEASYPLPVPYREELWWARGRGITPTQSLGPGGGWDDWPSLGLLVLTCEAWGLGLSPPRITSVSRMAIGSKVIGNNRFHIAGESPGEGAVRIRVPLS